MHVDILPRSNHVSCDEGESFYACNSGKFRGCCAMNPCALGVCEDSSLFVPGPEDTTTATEVSITSSSIRSRSSKFLPTAINDDDEDKSTKTNTEKDSEPSEVTLWPPPRTMTDSGTTHTIPNNDRVTVTKHTVIVTDKAPSRTPSSTTLSSSALKSTSVPSSGATSVVPVETAAVDGSPGDESNSTFSTGAIAGAAIGGAIALAIIALLAVVFLRRRKQKRPHSQASIEDIRESTSGEKNFFQAVSPHTTGTQGSGDPFAPFGGRADKPEDPHRPPSGTFEMEGTSTAPVELPAESPVASHLRSVSTPRSPDSVNREYCVQPSGPVDPRANLNASLTDRHQQTYVNHWNQYRSLGSER
ncbi:hypothetical protein AK830_g1088 [Neonectria ditissima]|uniref:Epidermal growth factor receptor-like transmembrane-juxtamembrane segment domain-containing protein n=1 Tax=Neonectria ditissima TaxID=78410 RepID=A0A0P7BVE7_9HYPO|nr:hypothetical protein AK830_g1088 [Neonectria ditissima]